MSKSANHAACRRVSDRGACDDAEDDVALATGAAARIAGAGGVAACAHAIDVAAIANGSQGPSLTLAWYARARDILPRGSARRARSFLVVEVSFVSMSRAASISSLCLFALACDRGAASPPGPPVPTIDTPTPSVASAPVAAPPASPSTSVQSGAPDVLVKRVNRALGIEYTYPSNVFPKARTTATGEALESKLSREQLGEGSQPKWTFSVTITKKPLPRLAAAKADLGNEMFAYLFPDGGVQGDPEESSETKVAGRDAYRTHTGVEGYNTDTVFVDAPGGGTLIVACSWVGSVMGPEIDADAQLAACESVWSSIVWK